MSNVTDVRCMFHCASSFCQDLSEWQMPNATNMRYMFYGASSLNQSASEWDMIVI